MKVLGLKGYRVLEKKVFYLGVWMWQESHEEVPYQNWCPGEPNNLNGDEDCVEKIGTDMWNDRPCDYNAPHALCQAHP